MIKSAAIALFLGVTNAENLISISVWPGVAKWYDRKHDLLSADVNTIYESGQFQKVVASAHQLEESEEIQNVKKQ
jgi:hypothetical protein